jgi:hypothetical protein
MMELNEFHKISVNTTKIIPVKKTLIKEKL